MASLLRRVRLGRPRRRRALGRPPVYGHDDVLLLVKMVTEPPPDAATCGRRKRSPNDSASMGADLGVEVWADLPQLGSEAVADRVVDDLP